MKSLAIKRLVGLVLMLGGMQVQALMLSPSDCGTTVNCWQGPSGPPANKPTVAEINTLIGTTDLLNLYESDVSSTGTSVDSQAFALSYDTVFSMTSTDPMNATISYLSSMPKIDCLVGCYLLVGGGASDPNWYLFDISFWDGMDTIDLTGFWPGQGAISNVKIYGGRFNVPEPGSLALVGIGLILLGSYRRFVLSASRLKHWYR